MKSMIAVCAWVLVAVMVAGEARAELRAWTVTQTRRVLRDEGPGNERAAAISAARNEWESFQVFVRSDVAAKISDVRLEELKGPDGAAIREPNIMLYREHQLELTIPTHRNDTFKAGWYPDALIPFKHPLTRVPLPKARFTAVPFDLPASETHGFWVDVHVPTDAKAGEYRGILRVMVQGGAMVETPVTLTVWGFALPAVPTLQTAFGSPAGRMRSYYRELAKTQKWAESPDWPAIETQCAAMLSDNRINATPPSGTLTPQAQPDGSFRIPPERLKELLEFVDRYHVNAVQIPHPEGVVKDPVAERTKLHAWLKAFDVAAAELNRPGLVFFTYLKDEPNDEAAYRYVQKWGKAIREAKSVVKVMVVEQTWTQNEAWGDLYGAVDIWCPLFSLHKQDSADRRIALGETVWTYTALCQGQPTPWWHTDFPLLNYRVPAWMAWQAHMRGLLYWGGMSYWSQVKDVWTDPKTYDRRKEGKGNLWNGEGSFVYPGRDCGYDGIAPSLRLKALRDSVEDYEYMAILDRAGKAEEARKVVGAVAGSFFTWDEDPGAYQKARAELAQMILKAGGAK